MRNKKNAKKAKTDDIDFKITDSQEVDDDIHFTVTNSRVSDDEIDFRVIDRRPADDDMDFSVTDSRVINNESDIDFVITDSRVDDSDIDFNITDSKVITNQNAKTAAKKISQKYKNIRQRKALKLLKLAALKYKNNKDPTSKKSATMTAKRISEKYKRLRKQKNVDLVADVQEALTNKNARIAAKKINQKYKKMRNKRTPIPFNLARLADADSVVYTNDTDLRDVSSCRSTNIAAKKILEKYKKMRSKKQSLSFNLSDTADADTVNYNDDTNLEDTNMNKNAVLTPKKISDKYRTIRRKRIRAKSPESIVRETKRPKTSFSASDKLTRIAAKKISAKYRKLHYGR